MPVDITNIPIKGINNKRESNIIFKIQNKNFHPDYNIKNIIYNNTTYNYVVNKYNKYKLYFFMIMTSKIFIYTWFNIVLK